MIYYQYYDYDDYYYHYDDYYYLQMGTLRGYSVNTPCSISRDCSPTPRWLKTPFKHWKERVPLQCTIETLETVRKTSDTISQTTYPEQG